MRLFKAILLLLVGIVLITGAILTPAYVRALDQNVLRASGGEPGLVSEGLSLLSLEKPGPASLIYQVSKRLEVDDLVSLESSLSRYQSNAPYAFVQGDTDPLIAGWLKDTSVDQGTVMGWMVSNPFRDKVRTFLDQSKRPGVQEILRHRDLTALSLFIPVAQPGGQALDASILLTGLLYQEDHLHGILMP